MKSSTTEAAQAVKEELDRRCERAIQLSRMANQMAEKRNANGSPITLYLRSQLAKAEAEFDWIEWECLANC